MQLRRRHDLVPNLVETVKGYADHERNTLDSVVQARNAAVAAQGPAAKAQAEASLSGALRQLFALSEAYPNLKASSDSCRTNSSTLREALGTTASEVLTVGQGDITAANAIRLAPNTDDVRNAIQSSYRPRQHALILPLKKGGTGLNTQDA